MIKTFHIIQRDTTGLSTENTELKLRLQAMEQQAHLRDGENYTSLLMCNCKVQDLLNIYVAAILVWFEMCSTLCSSERSVKEGSRAA